MKWIPFMLIGALFVSQRANAFSFVCQGVVTDVRGAAAGDFAVGDRIEGAWDFDGPFHPWGTGQEIINLDWGPVKQWTSDTVPGFSLRSASTELDIPGDPGGILGRPTSPPYGFDTCGGGSLGDRITLYARAQGDSVSMNVDFLPENTWIADAIHPPDFSAAARGDGYFIRSSVEGGYLVAFQLTDFRNVPEPALTGLLPVLARGLLRRRRGA